MCPHFGRLFCYLHFNSSRAYHAFCFLFFDNMEFCVRSLWKCAGFLNCLLSASNADPLSPLAYIFAYYTYHEKQATVCMITAVLYGKHAFTIINFGYLYCFMSMFDLNLGENVTWPNMQVIRSDSFPKLLEPHNYSAQHNILA